jgi:hypothetical protein
MRLHKETEKVIRVSSFTLVEKGKARGLEAADFVAWQYNKHYMDKVRLGRENDPRKDCRALVEIAGNKMKVMDLRGDDLKYFFSLISPGAKEISEDSLR